MKRYEYIMWDGMWDNLKEEYIDWYTIEDLCNAGGNNVRIWQNKYDEVKHENKMLKQKISYLSDLLRKYNIILGALNEWINATRTA